VGRTKLEQRACHQQPQKKGRWRGGGEKKNLKKSRKKGAVPTRAETGGNHPREKTSKRGTEVEKNQNKKNA